jgi:hypothetical protein
MTHSATAINPHAAHSISLVVRKLSARKIDIAVYSAAAIRFFSRMPMQTGVLL